MADTQKTLCEINSRLEVLAKQHPQSSDQEQRDWDELHVEKARYQSDLDAFSGVIALLEKVDLDSLDTIWKSPETDYLVRSTLNVRPGDRLTTADIRSFMGKIPQAMSDLKEYLGVLENKIRELGKFDIDTRRTFLQEKEVEESRFNLLSGLQDKVKEKRQNVYKEVRAAENARQFLISTVDDLMFCQDVTAGAASEQLMGTFSDQSFREYLHQRRTTSSDGPKVDQRGIPYNGPWFAWGFAALAANAGLLMWFGNHGRT